MKIISKTLMIVIVAIMGIAFVSCEKEIDTPTPELGVDNELYTTRSNNSYWSEHDIPNFVCTRLINSNHHKLQQKWYGVELRVKKNFNFSCFLSVNYQYIIAGEIIIYDDNNNIQYNNNCFVSDGKYFLKVNNDNQNYFFVQKGYTIRIIFKPFENTFCKTHWYRN